jgi:hypothetical protein
MDPLRAPTRTARCARDAHKLYAHWFNGGGEREPRPHRLEREEQQSQQHAKPVSCWQPTAYAPDSPTRAAIGPLRRPHRAGPRPCCTMPSSASKRSKACPNLPARKACHGVPCCAGLCQTGAVAPAPSRPSCRAAWPYPSLVTQQQRGGWGPSRMEKSLYAQLTGSGWRVAMSTAPVWVQQGPGLTLSLLSRLPVVCRCAAPARATRACLRCCSLARDLTLVPCVPLVSFLFVYSLLFS